MLGVARRQEILRHGYFSTVPQCLLAYRYAQHVQYWPGSLEPLPAVHRNLATMFMEAGQPLPALRYISSGAPYT
ncbi:hypothetical protein VTK26DRAFT_2696 [Humicola hyalothermophila]